MEVRTVMTTHGTVSNGQRERLLIVDDDPMSLDMFARRLERQGYSVERAADGREAMALIDNTAFDLVLLDHNMPEITGIDVLRKVRSSRTPLQLPVIMVTAANDSNTTVEALNAGANDYITKPLDFAVALARIRAQLARRSAEQSALERDRLDAAAVRGTSDGLWYWDLLKNEMYLSPSWKAMLGYADSEIENSAAEWISRIHADDSNAVQHHLECAITGVSDAFDSEHRLQHKDGTFRWVHTRARTVRDDAGTPLRLAGTQIDVTDTKMADPLTNLPNRTLFLERVREAAVRADRGRSAAFAVLLVDIDRFKVINDSLGHLVGDELLVGIARRLRELTHKFPVTLARLGGDEFAMLLSPLYPEQITKIGQTIQDLFAGPFPLEGRSVFCTLSVGVAFGPGDASKPEDLLRDADTAMYRAKALGGGRVEIFDAEMRKTAMARLELEADMRHSLAAGHFEVYYQPKVDLASSVTVGFEALVRWVHPRRGIVYPAEFIPVAEETGLIIPLGNWVIQQACHQLRQWHISFPRDPALYVSVNVSCRQLRDPGLAATVKGMLEETGLSPGSLHLEITESILIGGVQDPAIILEELKDIGVGLKIDDFGTGYSSLSYLCRLPFDCLKIDRSFVRGMPGETAEIVKTVIRLAESLGMSVIAEGVETREQVDQLRALGCNYGQGYYFSQAVAASEIDLLLKNEPAPQITQASS